MDAEFIRPKQDKPVPARVRGLLLLLLREPQLCHDPGEDRGAFRGARARRSLAIRPPPETAHEEKLFPDELQCPNVGMQSSEPGLVCCLAYGDREVAEDIASFMKSTCSKFLCPAWSELTDREVLFAARLMRDWYWYSLLINDIELLQDLCAEYDRPEDVPGDEMESVKSDLLDFFWEEDGK